MATIRTTCSYCSVGCNFDVQIDDDGKVTRFMPSKEYPVNQGRSCPKGFNLLTPFSAPDRLTTPLARNDQGELVPVSWEEAARRFVDGFRPVLEKYGPEAGAFLSTGQMPMEEMAFLGAFGKFGMGLVHGDGNTRQCMATAAVAYKQAFGFDSPPFTYTDFEDSDLLIFVGSNAAISHPVLWNRMKASGGDRTIIAIDPRATKTARTSDMHLQIRPKGDLYLLYSVAHVLIKNGWIDRDFIDQHATGFEEFAEFVTDFEPEKVAQSAGLSADQILDLAKRIHEAKATSIWWTMGVNQAHQAVRTAQAIINICLITGNIGKPGTGPNSITGQANAMGSRLFSNTTSLYAGYSFESAEDRQKIADLMGIDVNRIPQKNSLPYHKILERVSKGEMKALWVIATNPVHSWIGKKEQLLDQLAKLDFLVVQDLYGTTETAQVADLVLPAAGSAEKDGSFINSERRLGVVQKLVDAPGDAKSDFEILHILAKAWGCDDLFTDWKTPEDVFRFLVKTSEGRPCDITGIDGYEPLRANGGIQWPYPKENPNNETHRRLFADGKFYTPDQKARILYTEIEPVPEPVDEEFPFVLLTGRGTTVQFHTQTRTGKVPALKKHYPESIYVEVNPEDASRLGLEDGSPVQVSSRRGTLTATCTVTEVMAPGQVFLPMHYNETNFLTYPAFDTYSHEPSYKWAAVALAPGK